MAQFTLSDFVGLVTSPGLLSRSPASLVEADNVYIQTPGLIQTRRAYSRTANTKSGLVASVAYTTDGQIGAWCSAPSVYPGKNAFKYFTGGGDVTFPTGSPGIDVSVDFAMGLGRISAIQSQAMVYANSPVRILGDKQVPQKPVVRINSPTGTVASYAGMPYGMPPDTYNMGAAHTVLVNGTYNYLLPNFAVAFRVTWHRVTGGENAELVGPPTGRVVIRNISGVTGWVAATARSVANRIPIPKELFSTQALASGSGWYCKLWRSKAADMAVEEPNDDMYLVAQLSPSAADITNGYIAYTDNTPDEFLQTAPPLYTNTNDVPAGESNVRQGLMNANNAPPFAAHVAFWGGRAWYGNFTYVPNTVVRLISVGAPALQVNDTVTIGGLVLTAKAAPALATEFKLETGLASLELNIEATARNICEVFNRATTGTARAYLTSVGFGAGAQIEIIGATGTAVSFATSRAAAFSTQPPAYAHQRNGLAFSKDGRADAVAPCNYLSVGPTDAEIIALKPLRDRLFVFTSRGVYVVSGTGYWDYAVQEFDLTFKAIGKSLVAECEDRLYCWFREGIAEVSDAGVKIISAPIETMLGRYVNQSLGYQYLADLGFAIGYRTRHQVLFWYPTNKAAESAHCEKFYCFDVRTNAWTTGSLNPSKGYTLGGFGWLEGRSCGAVPVNPTSADLAVCWGTNSSGSAWEFVEELTAGPDGQADGTTWTIAAKVTFQFSTPDTEGAVHWQQTLVHFPADGFLTADTRTAYDNWAPLTFTVTHQAIGFPGIGAGAAQSPAVTNRTVARCEPPAQARRGQKMQVALAWTAQADFGVVGLTQTFRQGARFANGKGA